MPPDDFRALIDELAGLGDLQRKKIDAEDVTEQVVDLQGRLDTAEGSAERLRALLTEAPAVEAIVAIETELAQREAEVEALTGQLRVLQDRVELSTVTVTLTERNDAEVDDDIPGFMQGLRTGVVAFVNVLAVAVTVIGFSLPFLAVLVPLGLLGRRWRRRHPRKPKPPPFAYAQPPPPPTSPPDQPAPGVWGKSP